MKYLLLFTAVLSFLSLRAQIDKSERLTIDDGLVNNEVTSIHHDSYGFLWFGTRGGLSKYNGYNFETIRNLYQSRNNLSNQSIETICEGENGILWIGTRAGGLNSYNILKDSIAHHFPAKSLKVIEIKALIQLAPQTLLVGALNGLFLFSNNKYTLLDKTGPVLSLKKDSKNRIWVGTSIGLFQYDLKKNRLDKVNLGNGNIGITSIGLDNSSQILYLGTWGRGLIRYHIPSRLYKKFLVTQYYGTFSGNNTYRVFVDNRKNVWVGTWGEGLKKFDPKTERFEDIKLKPLGVFNKDYDIILAISQDRAGIIWIGTDGGGVSKLNPLSKKFNVITNLSGSQPILDNTHITAVFKDNRDGIWLGTRGSGLSYSSNRKDFVKKDLGISNVIRINTFFQNKNNLWVGTGDGLIIYENFLTAATPKVVKRTLSDSTTLSGPKVTAIVKDSSGLIWVGTQENGLNRVISFKAGLPVFKRYPVNPGVSGYIQNSRISCMLVDTKGRFWVGTHDGLHLYNRSKDNFAVVGKVNSLERALSNNTVLCLAEDRNGDIWVGTQQGLNKLIYEKNGKVTIQKFYQNRGFPNDYIHALLVDKKNNIWMSTNRGITRYNVQSNDFRNFDTRDGLSSNTFSENASFIAQNGEMFFGSISGLIYFYPDSIKLNHYQPPVYITGLKINNKNVSVNKVITKNKILSKALFLTEKITLSYEEDIITFSFAALDYYAADKNQYKYRLKGFDEKWVNADQNRSVTYTNLPSGSYSFEVKASNSDQIWSEKVAKLQVAVLPPPWRTWWAYMLYALIIGGLLWLSRSITLNRIYLKNKLEIANLNYEKEHEIATVKSKVFANISHEFRTPLTLMIGPLGDLSEDEDVTPLAKKTIARIQNQTKRLLSLVNQLLDFNKAESNALKLNPVYQDIIAVSKSVLSFFEDEAIRKNINLVFKTNASEIILWIDQEKIESIIYNLLSNAFKFTPNGGEICLCLNFVDKESSACELLVTDTGKGVDEEEKEKIFDRFYQVAQAEPGKYVGTGIGLAFVKDLVELHKGKISIESNQPTGSIFKIVLPAEEVSYREDLTYDSEKAVALHPDVPPEHDENELPILLVVEDNDELNHYLVETLSKIGKVISARDGKEGMKKAFKYIPDLIVSDVMMPEMDGFELCKILKEDYKTSHIPVILLTAKSDDISHIEGMQIGADSYLAKPFESAVLISHINNLIQSRNKLKELFKHQISIEPSTIQTSSLNEEFINNAILYTENNMLREDFSTDELASYLNMSRSTFYRKLKALTGMSGSDFIREIRLKRSAQLLKTGVYSVSMAAYAVGFNDLKSFRKSFQKQFGVTPSYFAKEK